jgi:hypothetical protein
MSFEDWLFCIFDNDADRVPYLLVDPDCDRLDLPLASDYLTRLFEQPDASLLLFNDAQINAGLWYLIGQGSAVEVFGGWMASLPLDAAQRGAGAIFTVFEQLFLPRCAPCLGHRSETSEAHPLNSVCYMWWDIIGLSWRPQSDTPRERTLRETCLDVMARTLDLDHDACRESALHGLGHWHLGHADQVERIIDRFLQRTPALRPELHAYALSARQGCVL